MTTARMHLVLRPRRLPVSARLSRRTLVAAAVVVVVVVLLAVAGMLLGDLALAPGEVVRALLGEAGVDARHELVVRDLRLPRVLTAVGVGAALAGSGALLQGVTRNPLVAPDIVGVTAGAAVGAVGWIVAGRPPSLLPVAAFAGALAAAAALQVLAWRGGIAGGRLVLVGIGLHTALMAVTTLLLVRFPIERVSSAVLWQTGTLHGAGWREVTGLAVGLVVLAPVALLLARRLQVLGLGDETAGALGLRTGGTRSSAVVVGAALAAIAVAAAGPVLFVALVTPHVARLLAGPMTAGVLVLAGALGAALVLASDLVAQHALPVIVPVGVVTAALGAPYFLFLLHRANAAS